MKKRALIFGVTGQDGSYLAEYLLSLGYDVHGVIRRASTPNTSRLSAVREYVTLHTGDVCDQFSVMNIMNAIEPHEVYNLAAQSFVGVSWRQPEHTSLSTGLGALHVLEAARTARNPPRVYQASSSEQYGSSPPPQSELTPFSPRSPYAVAKVYAHYMCKVYRESYGMHVSCGILFNHESPRRGAEFVTQKIAHQVVEMKRGNRRALVLGNVDSVRDWGFAGDYVKAMWQMLQQDTPDDYVIATGIGTTVREFVEMACSAAGVKPLIEHDPALVRPAEVHSLIGNATKAATVLQWKPEVSVQFLAEMMVAECLRT